MYVYKYFELSQDAIYLKLIHYSILKESVDVFARNNPPFLLQYSMI